VAGLDAPIAATAYGDLIEQQLAEERSRKTSLEQRGSFVITSASAVATLLLALAAVVTSEKHFHAGGALKVLLAVAASLFACAALFGLAANLPWRYYEVSENALKRLTSPDLWEAEIAPATRRIAEAKVAVLATARRANAIKSGFVSVALAAEMLGAAAVAAGVVSALI
jgi:hypothetical protein